MGLPYWMFRETGRYYLCVPSRHEDVVRDQLRQHRREDARWPPRGIEEEDAPEAESSGWPVLAAYAGILAGLYVLQLVLPGMERSGVAVSTLMREQEQWWRAVTALTLHGDVAHLMGNIVAGVCFGLLVNQSFRPGLGWMLVLAAGAAGNAANALFQTEHASLGASTAVFGALGLLVGNAMLYGLRTRGFGAMRRKLLPLVAGVVVLLFLGMGQPGDNTDVMAHIFGFVVGIPLGLAGAWVRRWEWPGAVDGWLAFSVPAVVALCWGFALAAG